MTAGLESCHDSPLPCKTCEMQQRSAATRTAACEPCTLAAPQTRKRTPNRWAAKLNLRLVAARPMIHTCRHRMRIVNK
jgi:hypothetical protein